MRARCVCNEVIHKAGIRWDWALSQVRCAIHVGCASLMSSMPVDDSALTAKVVCDLHHYSVSQAYLNTSLKLELHLVCKELKF
jgi:hypothetical protein